MAHPCTYDLQVDVPDRENAWVIRIVIFGKHAESAAGHLEAGSTVFVAGHLRQQERGNPEGQ